MEKAAATGNNDNLYGLINNNLSREATESAVIRESDGILIQARERQLELWTKHFREQFS